jgi:hypothetical protein
MPNTKSKPYVSGDVFIREGLPREYDTESVSVSNGTGAAYDLKAGQFMTAAAPTLVAGIAAFDGLLLDDVYIPAGESRLCAIVRKGTGIVVNFNMLPTLDAAGASLVASAATIKTRLETLLFVWRLEPTNQEEQLK